MNFLAPALLSPDDDEIRAGNVCADLVKGRVDGAVASGIATGIESSFRVLTPALCQHVDQVLTQRVG